MVRNEPEPDAFMFHTDSGLVNDDGYAEGSPELVIEIANSSVARDLGVKKRAYERNGIREYIVWRVRDQAIDWFQLRDGAYVKREPDADGVIESEAFPGLRLNVEKALNVDLAGVLGELA